MKTIAIDEVTFEKLKELKKELDAKSYREAILRLLEKTKNVPATMFGACKGMRPLTKKEHEEFERNTRRF